MKDQLGSQPIQPELRELMNQLAHGLDGIFNGNARPKKVGFVLMAFPFGKPGRCNYISNSERADVLTMLKEQVRYFEGAPEIDNETKQ